MSHPDPSKTYAEDLMNQWPEEEMKRLWEMYVEESRQRGVKPSMSDFLIYLEERL